MNSLISDIHNNYMETNLLDEFQIEKYNFKTIYNMYNLLKTSHLSSKYMNHNHSSRKNIGFTKNQLFNIIEISRFFPKVIEEYLLSTKTQYTCYHFSANNRIFNIHVYHYKHIFNDDDINYIKSWFSMVSNYAPANCSTNLDVYLFFTPFQKYLPKEKNSQIEPKHVNSAYTYGCSKRNKIIIYRYEEWKKVLLHESFHTFNFDFHNNNFQRLRITIKDIFRIQSEYEIFETYCETWATIIHILFIYQQNDNLQLNDPRVVFNDINKLLEKEVMFSLFQCCKILVHFKISYDDMCNINTNGHMSKINNFKETTPIISYFFFKTILLFNACKFADWCSLNNMNNMLIFSDDNHEYRKKRDFAGMIKDLYREVNFLRYITYVQTKYNEADVDAFSANTLRMTLLDV